MLLERILAGRADVVYGSPFAGGKPHRVLYFWHLLGNRFLTLCSNALTGSKSTLEFKPLPEDDPRKRLPDIALARERLGWEPVVSLEEGLRKTIGYFEEMLLGTGS